MTKTALENKKLQVSKEMAERSAAATEHAARSKANAVDRATNERRRQFDKDLTRKWHETGSKMINDAAGTVGRVIASAINDPKFYLAVPGIGELVGSLPTYYPLGTKVKETHSTSGAQSLAKAIPSVAALWYLPAIGSQNIAYSGVDPNSAINLAMSRFITEARKYNSRIGEYEPGDAGQIMIAASSVMERASFARKMLAVYNLVDSGRYDIAKAIFKASGIVFDLSTKQACVDRLAILVDKINKTLYIPKPFYYVERKIQLAMALYGDQDLRFGQFITTGRPYRLSYDEENAVVSSNDNFTSVDATLPQFIEAIEDDLNALHYSSALTTFWADLRAAYKDCYQVVPPTAGDKLEIKPVNEALHQVLNISMPPLYSESCGAFGSGADIARVVDHNSVAIRQDSNGLIYQGISTTHKGISLCDPNTLGNYTYDTCAKSSMIRNLPAQYLGSSEWLNFYKDKIEVEDIMVASRLNVGWAIAHDTRYTNTYLSNSHPEYIQAVSCGTEIPICFRVVELNSNSNTTLVTAYHISRFIESLEYDDDENYIARGSEPLRGLARLGQYSTLDWMPLVQFVFPMARAAGQNVLNWYDGTNNTNPVDIWQVGNMLHLPTQNREFLHRAAVLSEFSTPVDTSYLNK